MLHDYALQLSDNQQVIASGFTLSTNTVDLVAAFDYFRGEQLYLHTLITEAYSGGTGTSLFIVPFTSATATLSAGALSNIPLGFSPQLFLIAGHMNLGARLSIPLAPISQDWFNVTGEHNRYLGVRYQTDAAFTTGSITTMISTQSMADDLILPTARHI